MRINKIAGGFLTNWRCQYKTIKWLLYIWYSEYLKDARRYISFTGSIGFLSSTLFFHASDMLLILLQFLHADYNILGFGEDNIILVNALSKYFFVVNFGRFWSCFFKGADFVLVWAAFALSSLILLSLSFFVLSSRYPS